MWDVQRVGANLQAACENRRCGHAAIFPIDKLLRYILMRRWPDDLSLISRKFRCSRCSCRGARLAPTESEPTATWLNISEDAWKRLQRRLRG